MCVSIGFLLIAAGFFGVTSAWNPFKKKDWNKAGNAIEKTANQAADAVEDAAVTAATAIGKIVAKILLGININDAANDIQSITAQVDTMMTYINTLKKAITGPDGILKKVASIERSLDEMQKVTQTTLSLASLSSAGTNTKDMVESIGAIENNVQIIPNATGDFINVIVLMLLDIRKLRNHLGKLGEVAVNDDVHTSLGEFVLPATTLATSLKQLDLRIDKLRLAAQLSAGIVANPKKIPTVIIDIKKSETTFSAMPDLGQQVKVMKNQALAMKDQVLDIPSSVKGADPLGNVYKELNDMNTALRLLLMEIRSMIDAVSAQLGAISTVAISFKNNLNVDIFKDGTIAMLEKINTEVNALTPKIINMENALKKPITHFEAFKRIMNPL